MCVCLVRGVSGFGSRSSLAQRARIVYCANLFSPGRLDGGGGAAPPEGVPCSVVSSPTSMFRHCATHAAYAATSGSAARGRLALHTFLRASQTACDHFTAKRNREHVRGATSGGLHRWPSVERPKRTGDLPQTWRAHTRGSNVSSKGLNVIHAETPTYTCGPTRRDSSALKHASTHAKARFQQGG